MQLSIHKIIFSQIKPTQPGYTQQIKRLRSVISKSIKTYTSKTKNHRAKAYQS